jgi:hypothetical protein
VELKKMKEANMAAIASTEHNPPADDIVKKKKKIKKETPEGAESEMGEDGEKKPKKNRKKKVERAEGEAIDVVGDGEKKKKKKKKKSKAGEGGMEGEEGVKKEAVEGEDGEKKKKKKKDSVEAIFLGSLNSNLGEKGTPREPTAAEMAMMLAKPPEVEERSHTSFQDEFTKHLLERKYESHSEDDTPFGGKKSPKRSLSESDKNGTNVGEPGGKKLKVDWDRKLSDTISLLQQHLCSGQKSRGKVSPPMIKEESPSRVSPPVSSNPQVLSGNMQTYTHVPNRTGSIHQNQLPHFMKTAAAVSSNMFTPPVGAHGGTGTPTIVHVKQEWPVGAPIDQPSKMFVQGGPQEAALEFLRQQQQLQHMKKLKIFSARPRSKSANGTPVTIQPASAVHTQVMQKQPGENVLQFRQGHPTAVSTQPQNRISSSQAMSGVQKHSVQHLVYTGQVPGQLSNVGNAQVRSPVSHIVCHDPKKPEQVNKPPVFVQGVRPILPQQQAASAGHVLSHIVCHDPTKPEQVNKPPVFVQGVQPILPQQQAVSAGHVLPVASRTVVHTQPRQTVPTSQQTGILSGKETCVAQGLQPKKDLPVFSTLIPSTLMAAQGTSFSNIQANRQSSVVVAPQGTIQKSLIPSSVSPQVSHSVQLTLPPTMTKVSTLTLASQQIAALSKNSSHVSFGKFPNVMTSVGKQKVMTSQKSDKRQVKAQLIQQQHVQKQLEMLLKSGINIPGQVDSRTIANALTGGPGVYAVHKSPPRSRSPASGSLIPHTSHSGISVSGMSSPVQNIQKYSSGIRTPTSNSRSEIFSPAQNIRHISSPVSSGFGSPPLLSPPLLLPPKLERNADIYTGSLGSILSPPHLQNIEDPTASVVDAILPILSPRRSPSYTGFHEYSIPPVLERSTDHPQKIEDNGCAPPVLEKTPPLPPVLHSNLDSQLFDFESFASPPRLEPCTTSCTMISTPSQADAFTHPFLEQSSSFSPPSTNSASQASEILPSTLTSRSPPNLSSSEPLLSHHAAMGVPSNQGEMHGPSGMSPPPPPVTNVEQSNLQKVQVEIMPTASNSEVAMHLVSVICLTIFDKF